MTVASTPPAGSTAAVVFQAVDKSYGARSVLRSLSLRVRPGEIYGLLGPNGAGKSTAIHILTGLCAPDAGRVRVLGLPVNVLPRDALGVVPQEIALYPHLTVAENLRFLAGLFGYRGTERTRRVEEVLQTFTLTGYRDTLVTAMSGGWQRRLNFAAGVVHRPSVLILDEPTVGLDVEARAEVHGVIRRFAREGAAVLLTSHLFDEMDSLPHRVGILHRGHLVREGTVADLTAALPIRQVAYLESPEPERLMTIAERAGWKVSEQQGRIALHLPRETELAALVERFRGVPLTSAALEPVSLAHAYLDAVGG